MVLDGPERVVVFSGISEPSMRNWGGVPVVTWKIGRAFVDDGPQQLVKCDLLRRRVHADELA